MTKVFHFLLEKLAFDWFQPQSNLNYLFQDHLEVLFQCLRKDKNIVYIDGHKVRAIFRVESISTCCMSRWKTLGAFVRPNGIIRNLNNP